MERYKDDLYEEGEGRDCEGKNEKGNDMKRGRKHENTKRKREVCTNECKKRIENRSE